MNPLRFTRRLGLRARITLAFAVGALLLSALLSATAWAFTRENLVRQQEDTAMGVIYTNAAAVIQTRPDQDGMPEFLASRSTAQGGSPLIFMYGQWTPYAPEFGEEQLPSEFISMVLDQHQAARMRTPIAGEMHLIAGVPLEDLDAAYVEAVSLAELESGLETLGVTLVGASVITTLAGAGLGWWASRRTLRPLAGVSTAAASLAAGRLDTRLPASDDPDLAPIAASFNEMAQALQDRIERDARFASDVSHELRSPLMTMAASVAVMQNQRDDLSERARTALDLMALDVERFSQLVEDLLEISRFDAGVARLDLEEVHLAELVMQAVAHSSDADVPVEVDADLAGVVVRADKRRIVRVIANLLDNAAKYGDGADVVGLRKVDSAVQIAVQDRGEGVPNDDREVIFDRFSRGVSAGRRGGSEGMGLGLALVAEHVNLHGGRVWVEDRSDGRPGARFVVELPVQERAPVPTEAHLDESTEPTPVQERL